MPLHTARRNFLAGVALGVVVLSGQPHAQLPGAVGNGYVDDIHGWDFYNDDSSIYDGQDQKARHGLNLVAANDSCGGGGYSQAFHDAIIRAAKAGILFVAAAGNGNVVGIAQNNDKTATSS